MLSKEFLITMKDGATYVHKLDFETDVERLTAALHVSGGIVIPKTVGHVFCPEKDIVRIDDLHKTNLTSKEFLKELSKAYSEHRSDISEIIDAYIEKNENHINEYREHRFIKGTIAEFGIRVEYDTLTTHISFEDSNGEWKNCENYEYYDN